MIFFQMPKLYILLLFSSLFDNNKGNNKKNVEDLTIHVRTGIHRRKNKYADIPNAIGQSNIDHRDW